MSTEYAPSLSHPRPPVAVHAIVTKVLSGTTAEQISNQRRLYKSINLAGFKGNNTANGASVHVGFGPNYQPFVITAGGSITISADTDGWPNDLSKLWLRGASGDGIVATFQEGLDI